MSLKEDVEKINEKVEQTSFAYELLLDARKINKRMFIIILVMLGMWFATVGLFVYYINTTGYEVITESTEVDNESGNANACIGNNCNNGEINYGESKGN